MGNAPIEGTYGPQIEIRLGTNPHFQIDVFPGAMPENIAHSESGDLDADQRGSADINSAAGSFQPGCEERAEVGS
jgi:hypothetical protein